ncbi:hypothetical protein SSBG_06123 [Streptomyces sp. SPB074]|nr:hypothetical protein SSBG_06123 [Streptomyces sp. SPB074]
MSDGEASRPGGRGRSAWARTRPRGHGAMKAPESVPASGTCVWRGLLVTVREKSRKRPKVKNSLILSSEGSSLFLN